MKDENILFYSFLDLPPIPIVQLGEHPNISRNLNPVHLPYEPLLW